MEGEGGASQGWVAKPRWVGGDTKNLMMKGGRGVCGELHCAMCRREDRGAKRGKAGPMGKSLGWTHLVATASHRR